jgi:hypothetical protein
MEDTHKKLTLEEREEVLAKIEAKMAQGCMRTSLIAKEARCSYPMAAQYVRAIQARWRASQNIDWNEIRIELLEKCRELEMKLWESYIKADNTSAALGILRTILDVQKQQAMLGGVYKVMDAE